MQGYDNLPYVTTLQDDRTRGTQHSRALSPNASAVASEEWGSDLPSARAIKPAMNYYSNHGLIAEDEPSCPSVASALRHTLDCEESAEPPHSGPWLEGRVRAHASPKSARGVLQSTPNFQQDVVLHTPPAWISTRSA